VSREQATAIGGAENKQFGGVTSDHVFRHYGRATRPAASAGGQGPTPIAKRRLRWRQDRQPELHAKGPAVTKHTTEAFSVKYVGLDVHKEAIAVAVADSGTAEPRGLGIIPRD
jgi:hypothetical protein